MINRIQRWLDSGSDTDGSVTEQLPNLTTLQFPVCTDRDNNVTYGTVTVVKPILNLACF